MRFAASSWLLATVLLSGCNGCERERPVRKNLSTAECRTTSDCADQNPCTNERCENGACLRTLADRGASCDDGDVCNGVSACDDRGRCVPGSAPRVDDGNPCTYDSCDPSSGVAHEPIPVDDHDLCTADACDPATGSITHTTLPVDDGNDCTVDRCDPARGVEHVETPPFYTCDASCSAGFHVALRRTSARCGSATAPETFCSPVCGATLYTCDAACPRGYHPGASKKSRECGDGARTFCTKSAGDSFYSCGASCPDGYVKRAEAPGPDCGERSNTRVFCVKR